MYVLVFPKQSISAGAAQRVHRPKRKNDGNVEKPPQSPAGWLKGGEIENLLGSGLVSGLSVLPHFPFSSFVFLFSPQFGG